jgi:pilus assembly protein CpaB
MGRLPPWMWLVLALVFGTVATFMALGWLKRQSQMAQQPGANLAPIVVASKDISSATTLSGDQLTVQQWPKENCPKGAFAKAEELNGRVNAYSFSVGEPILESKLAPPGAPPGLTALVPPNKRAMTVKVDEASGVAGFLNPDSRVDVMVTMNKGEYTKDPISRVVLQDLRVLGVGQKIERRPGEKPQVVPTVTLEVSPEEGERLALAAQEGHIALVLRGLKDQSQVNTGGVSVNQLLGTAPVKPSPEAAKESSPSPPQHRREVEVFRKLKKEAVNF